jgi:hypothetical protein
MNCNYTTPQSCLYEQAPDDIVQSVLDFFRRVKATRKTHPLAKFAGILSDVEAKDLKRAMSHDKPPNVGRWM